MTKPKSKILQRDDQRYQQWVDGTGPRADRTAVEATLARLTYFESDLSGIGAILRMAWHPNGPEILHALMQHAQLRPGHEGLTVAVKSAIDVWTDVWRAPRKEGGRPSSWERLEGTVWLDFQGALGNARLKNPDLSQADMMEQFVGDGRSYRVRRELNDKRPPEVVKLTSVAQLEKRLKAFRRRVPEAERQRTLQKFFPDVCHLLGAPLHYDDHVVRWAAHCRLQGDETPTP